MLAYDSIIVALGLTSIQIAVLGEQRLLPELEAALSPGLTQDSTVQTPPHSH